MEPFDAVFVAVWRRLWLLTCELYFSFTAWRANQPKPVFAEVDVGEEEEKEE